MIQIDEYKNNYKTTDGENTKEIVKVNIFLKFINPLVPDVH